MRAMKTAASAGGPISPAQRAVMETAERVISQIDADIDALQPIDAAPIAPAPASGTWPVRIRRHRIAHRPVFLRIPRRRLDRILVRLRIFHRRLLRLGRLRARRHDGLFRHARKRRA
jgi:hypothetical protein